MLHLSKAESPEHIKVHVVVGSSHITNLKTPKWDAYKFNHFFQLFSAEEGIPMVSWLTGSRLANQLKWVGNQSLNMVSQPIVRNWMQCVGKPQKDLGEGFLIKAIIFFLTTFIDEFLFRTIIFFFFTV